MSAPCLWLLPDVANFFLMSQKAQNLLQKAQSFSAYLNRTGFDAIALGKKLP